MTANEQLQLGFFDSPSADSSAAERSSHGSTTDLGLYESVLPDVSTRPARGRAAIRARTAVLFSRLQEHGLRDVERLVLTRTRTVMVSLIGRSLRIHEGYADASERVLLAVVDFVQARDKAKRQAARQIILSFDVGLTAVRRTEPPRAGDVALLTQLAEAHRELNEKWFGGELQQIALNLSSRMATRLGHFDPGSRNVKPEIVLSRRHVVRDGWRETMQTLLHEMVHQWQHETGQPVDHGAMFRRKAREIGIVAAAKRPVDSVFKTRRRLAR